MGTWDLAGIHGINKYVWSILQADLSYTTTPYGGLIPITTPQQQPEFNAIDAPYIVYTYSRTTTGDDYWFEGEVAAYTIFASQDVDVRKATNLLAARLNKGDDTASAVNTFIKANGSADQKQFDYKNISVSSTQGSQPSMQEGGRYDGLVVIKYSYTHYDPATGIAVRY